MIYSSTSIILAILLYANSYFEGTVTPVVGPKAHRHKRTGTMAGRTQQCRFFLQGNCRYGSSCRFSHSSSGSRGGGGRSSGGRGFSGGGGGGFSGGGNGSNPFGGGGGNGRTTSNPFGGGSTSAAPSSTTGVAMTETSRSLAIEELEHPPMWPLSGFAVAKGVRSIGEQPDTHACEPVTGRR